MSRRRPAPAAPLLSTLLLALGLALLPGCAGPPPLWAELDFERIGYGNLYVSIVDLLEVEGYVVASRNPDSGVIETEWLIGPSIREVRGPSRRKAVVEVEPTGERLHVRLRVREQVIRKAGMGATNLRFNDDWEDYRDNWDDAEYLAAKLRALLMDFHAVDAVVLEGADAP